jgi:hypothetical protein
VQIAHRSRSRAPIAVVRVADGAAEHVREIGARDVSPWGWQRVAIRFPCGGADTVGCTLESTGEAALRVGSIAFWPRTGRPFWAISHMSNAPELVARDLASGANAIECDLGPRNGRAGGELTVFHRFAPPYVARSSKRTPLPEFLEALQGRLDALSAVLIDCHSLEQERYRLFGRRLAAAFRGKLPSERTIVAVQDPDLAATFDGLDDEGLRCGRDLHVMSSSKSVENEEWIQGASGRRVNVTGIGTDCFVPWDFLQTWFETIAIAVNARERGEGPAKVYYWTLAAKAAMRKVLDLGVDGLLVKRPRALREVLAEEPYRFLYRLATPDDSQFIVHGP